MVCPDKHPDQKGTAAPSSPPTAAESTDVATDTEKDTAPVNRKQQQLVGSNTQQKLNVVP